jgi:hypothetical protein
LVECLFISIWMCFNVFVEMPSRKTSDISLLTAAVRYAMQHLPTLSTFFGARRWRKLKFSGYVKKMKVCTVLQHDFIEYSLLSRPLTMPSTSSLTVRKQTSLSMVTPNIQPRLEGEGPQLLKSCWFPAYEIWSQMQEETHAPRKYNW